MNVDGDQPQRIPGKDGQVEEVAVVGEHPERKRELRVEAGEDGPVVLLEGVLDLLDDYGGQVELSGKVAGLPGDRDSPGKVHLHESPGDALSSWHDVQAGEVLAVSPEVVLEVDQGLAVRGQSGRVDVEVIAGEQEELPV